MKNKGFKKFSQFFTKIINPRGLFYQVHYEDTNFDNGHFISNWYWKNYSIPYRTKFRPDKIVENLTWCRKFCTPEIFCQLKSKTCQIWYKTHVKSYSSCKVNGEIKETDEKFFVGKNAEILSEKVVQYCDIQIH